MPGATPSLANTCTALDWGSLEPKSSLCLIFRSSAVSPESLVGVRVVARLPRSAEGVPSSHRSETRVCGPPGVVSPPAGVAGGREMRGGELAVTSSLEEGESGVLHPVSSVRLQASSVTSVLCSSSNF